jgi:hypothetical protein
VQTSQNVASCNELTQNAEILNLGNVRRQRVGFKPWSVCPIGNGVMDVGVKRKIQEKLQGKKDWPFKLIL